MNGLLMNVALSYSFENGVVGILRCQLQKPQGLAHSVVETAIVSNACVWIYLRSVSDFL